MADVTVNLVIDEENLRRLRQEQPVEGILLRQEGDSYRLHWRPRGLRALVWPEDVPKETA